MIESETPACYHTKWIELMLMQIINKQSIIRDRREFHLSQRQEYSPGDNISNNSEKLSKDVLGEVKY